MIDVEEDCSIVFTFLFDLIEFFDCSILESKIVKKCESFLGVKFISNHPSSASLDSCDWGHVMFFYDAKQGDLSLEINFINGFRILEKLRKADTEHAKQFS